MTAVWQYLLSRKVLRGLSRGLAFALLFLAVPLLAYYAYARFAVPVVTLTNVVEGPVVQPGPGQVLTRGVEVDGGQRLDHRRAGGHGPPHGGQPGCRDAELELGLG